MSEIEKCSSVASDGSLEVVTSRIRGAAPATRQEWTAMDSASVRLRLLRTGVCCRSKPRVRWIRSKGAILVLFWNCLILDYSGNLGYILSSVLQLSSEQAGGVAYITASLIQALSLVVLYPLAGWIADAYFGRYRVIKWSLWLMWIGAIIFASCLCLNLTLSDNQEKLQTAAKVLLMPVALLVMQVGVAGFKANVIPFGTDQLPTGSGDQLSGFITWFVFTLTINIGIVSFPFSCPLISSSSAAVLLRLLFQTALLSVALVLDSFCRGWLVIEPNTTNPFKLVARVLNYARKNKQPRFRSAFTYQGYHTKPSRIEYAKMSFGGPFTTEEVEDVKTFLRILYVLIPMGATLALNIYGTQVVGLFSEHINSRTLSCYGHQILSGYFAFLILVCAIPLYEFLLYPTLLNYIPSMLTRVGIGIIFFILSYVVLFTVDLVGHQVASPGQNGSMDYSCVFDEDKTAHHLNINPFWSILPETFVALGTLFHITAIYEFVFSQSPYNMKGLLVGAIYAAEGAFQLLGLALQIPFYLGYVNSITICGSVYLVLLLILTTAWLVVYVVLAHVYHRREREETKRQQDYAEEYYSKYLED